MEKRCEIAETETSAAKTDLKLALKRIEDLQSAIQGELEDTSEHTDRYVFCLPLILSSKLLL